jgi:predicted ATPase
LQRGASIVDKAAVYNLKVLLHVVKGVYPQAIDITLTCLSLFGVNFPTHPSWEQVQAEYETVWRNLDGRSIESLIDLPLMTDPELRALMEVSSVGLTAALYTNRHLYCLILCHLVNACATAAAMASRSTGSSARRWRWDVSCALS